MSEAEFDLCLEACPPHLGSNGWCGFAGRHLLVLARGISPGHDDANAGAFLVASRFCAHLAAQHARLPELDLQGSRTAIYDAGIQALQSLEAPERHLAFSVLHQSRGEDWFAANSGSASVLRVTREQVDLIVERDAVTAIEAGDSPSNIATRWLRADSDLDAVSVGRTTLAPGQALLALPDAGLAAAAQAGTTTIDAIVSWARTQEVEAAAPNRRFGAVCRTR